MGTKEVVWAAAIAPFLLQLGTGVLCLAITEGESPLIFDNALSRAIGTLRWPVFLLHNVAREAFVTPLREVESAGGVHDFAILCFSMGSALVVLMLASFLLHRVFLHRILDKIIRK